MEDYINNLPIKQVLLFLVLGALLHFVFYLISNYVLPILEKKKSSIALYWHRIEILVWTLFLLVFFTSLFLTNIFLTLSISLILLGVGWTYWTNFFAGIVIKFTNHIKVNDRIETEMVTGKIRAIKMTFTEIINTKGELVIIPNNLLRKSVVKHTNKKNTLELFSFNYKPRNDTSQNVVYQHALNCPYFSGNQDIRINKENNEEYLIEAMLIDQVFKEKVFVYFENLGEKK